MQKTRFLVRLLTCILLIAVYQTVLADEKFTTLPPEIEKYFDLAKELEAKGDRRSIRKLRKRSVKPLMDIAEEYYKSERYDEAITIYKRLYEIQKRHYGKHHRRTQRFVKKLAYVYQLAGRHTEQAKIEQALLDAQQQYSGGNDRQSLKMMSNLAFTYKENKAYARSEALYLRALKIHEDNGMTHRHSYQKLLYQLASLYIDQGDYASAEPYYRRSLGLKEGEEIQVSFQNFINLYNYGFMLQLSGRYTEAESLFKKMLVAVRENKGMASFGVLSQESQILANLGAVYNQMEAYEKALKFKQQAYNEYKASLGEEHVITAYAGSNLAETYIAMKQYDKALELLKKSAEILNQQVKQKHQIYIDKNFVMPYLALAYSKTGNYAKAEEIYQQVFKEVSKDYSPRHPLMTYSQINLAEVYYFQDRLEQAAKLCLLSLGNAVNNKSPNLLARLNFMLAKVRQKQALYAEAIFYGKQGVNQLQKMRSGLVGTDKSLQKSFVESQQENYEVLAGWLIDAGRLSEAEQVLAMLKEEEYFNFIRRSKGGNPQTTQAQLNPLEKQQKEKLTRSSRSLTAYNNELSDLEIIDPKALTDKDKQRIKTLHTLLGEAEKTFQSTLAEIKKSFIGKDTRKISAQLDSKSYSKLINKLGGDVALIHFLPLNNDLRVILRTSKLNIAKKINVTEKQFNQVINKYRAKIKRTDLTSPLAQQELSQLSQQLYQWLFEPIEIELQQANIKTLMLYKNGSLRYIPLATLYDGKRYLIEKYAVSNYTAAANASFETQPEENWIVAGMGVSKQFADFSPLHMVPYELDGIVKKNNNDPNGIFKGSIFVNEAFTAAQFKANMNARYNVGHIATHYVFKPGTETDSFLLMGDGRHLTLATLRKENYNFKAIDLLTLSACDTAVSDVASDGREVEGLATLVQRQGAKAVMATLWPVADCSTGQFMQGFYKHRRSGLSKAAALRQSQLDFIQNKVPQLAVRPKQQEKGCQPLRTQKTDGYKHPYYWAPFILMGNWQ